MLALASAALTPRRTRVSSAVPMARVTVEDCLDKVPNRFALVVLAAERARQLSRGANPGVDCDNKPAVTALREIAAGLVTFREDVRNTVIEFIVERRKAGFMCSATEAPRGRRSGRRPKPKTCRG